jgi:hypothetical protein
MLHIQLASTNECSNGIIVHFLNDYQSLFNHKLCLQFEISVGNAGNTIDGQMQSQPPTRVGGSISGPSGGGGDTDSVQSAPLEDTGNPFRNQCPNNEIRFHLI